MAGRPPSLRSLVRALAKLSPAQIKKLVSKAPQDDKKARLERERQKHVSAIQKLDRQIAKLKGGNGSDAAPARRARKSGRRKGFKLSASTRAKMRAAALRRYSKSKPDEATRELKPRKHRMSAEGRQRIADAARRRWAAARAAKEGQKVEEKV